MSSVIETGHAKNVANLADLISFCTGYGATFNPSKSALKVSSLANLLTTAQQAINAVNVSNTAYNNAVNDRMLGFKPLKPTATRIIGALAATDATTEVLKDAKTINRKLQGQRAKATEQPTAPNTPAPKTISTSQQSYDSLIEHLDKLIILLQAEASYTPNESDLQTNQLTNFKNELSIQNQAVVDTYTTISNARITRDKILYAPKTGLCDIAADVKNYVKSIFGASSPEYKQVNSIQFKKIKP